MSNWMTAAERGVGGVEPLDGRVYKVRVKVAGNGSQPFYYSHISAALEKAQKAKADGTLLYFAEYRLEERFDA